MEEIGIKALNGIVDTIQKWLDQAPAYVVDLVHRYGSYYWWTNISSAILAFIMICLCIWWIKKWLKEYKEDEDVWGSIVLSCWCILFVSFILMWYFIIQSFKGFYVPEVALINEFTPSCSR